MLDKLHGGDLKELALGHSEQWGKDGLYMFLMANICIRERLKKAFPGSGEVLQLAEIMKRQCRDLYLALIDGQFSPDRVPQAWAVIFLEYTRDRFAFNVLLPKIAQAQILDILERGLFNVEIEKPEYREIVNAILTCFDENGRNANVQGNLREHVIALLNKTLSGRSDQPVTEQWHELAWILAQHRKLLYANYRRTSNLYENDSRTSNLIRWQRSGHPERWVQEHGGQWTHWEWQQLLAELKKSTYWPLVPDDIGMVLEGFKKDHHPAKSSVGKIGAELPQRAITKRRAFRDVERLRLSRRYYSCFISYSSKDTDFVKLLYRNLREKRVQCWFAPEALKGGDKIGARIEESIAKHEKLLLILSRNSIASPWVEREVTAAMEREDKFKKTLLVPIRVDDAVMKSRRSWVADIRRSRHIVDFRGALDRAIFPQAFSQLLRALVHENVPDLK